MENKNQDAINNTHGNAISRDDKKIDLMEMLTEHDYYFPTNTSIFDVIGAPSSIVLPQNLDHETELFEVAPALEVTSEIANAPTTPHKFSLISWSSNETGTEDQVSKQTGEDGEDGKVDDKNKKLLKPKNMNTKKKKEPRFAFKTVSDIDNMDDGYKWRKYGQKAVKNSPFPRNYYRCTSAGCGVKKKVERSSEESSMVITTYEGTHNHICPVNVPRGNMGNYLKSYGFTGSCSDVSGGMDGSLSSVVRSGNFSSGIGGDVRAKLSGGIGGNVSKGISGHGGGSIGGRFSSDYDGSTDNIGGASGDIVDSFGTRSGGSYSAGIDAASSSIGGRFSGGYDDVSDNIGGANDDIVGSFGMESVGNYSADIGAASGSIGGRFSNGYDSAIDNIGASGGIVGSFGTVSGGSYSDGPVGFASGSIGRRFSSGNGNCAFSYGLGGVNFSSGIQGAGGSIGGNFSGGGSFTSGISTSSKSDIVDNISCIGMITNNAYDVGAIGSSSIGSHAIKGGHIGTCDIKLPYAIEEFPSYRQHQHKPHLYNNPSLSSYTFRAANVVDSAGAAGAPAPAPTNTCGAATTSCATIGFGSSSKNNNIFTMEMYEELAMLRQHALLEDILAPLMQDERQKDQD